MDDTAILACRALVAWFESERTGPDYGSLNRDTHPDGEEIWRAWWTGQLAQCDRAERLARQAIDLNQGE